MKSFRNRILSDIITLIRACYSRYSSYRIAKAGMQELTQLFQFIADRRKPTYGQLI